jgi:parallel beta-helix repeat protein
VGVARSAPVTRLRGLGILGFPGSGLVIEADDVTVQGCAIGLRADGSVDGNGGDGIGTSPTLRPDRATIGRDFDPALGFVGEGNVVVASGGHGIRLFGDDHRIAGNVVGSDASGSTGRIRGVATRNLGGGIWVSGARNAVGWSARAGTGTRHVSGNLVSGNAATGITVAGPRARIEGNRVGTTGTGLAALPNLGSGIDLRDASSPALRGNLVAGNAGSGVLVSPRSRPVLEDNRIGPSLDDQGGVGRTDTASGPLGSAGPS